MKENKGRRNQRVYELKRKHEVKQKREKTQNTKLLSEIRERLSVKKKKSHHLF